MAKQNKDVTRRNSKGQTLETFLKSYDPDRYPKPSVTTDIVVFTIQNKEVGNRRMRNQKELQVLLVKRRDHPYIGQWALPGGFLEMNEGLLESAKRELQEETNVQDVYLEQLYTFGEALDRDPRMRVISVAYMALIGKGKQRIVASDDAEDAKWFSIKRKENWRRLDETSDRFEVQRLEKSTTYELISDDGETIAFELLKKIERRGATQEKEITSLSEDGLAFDHQEILDYALERIASKAEYTPIVFNLMPERFTLSDLQQVYEVILNQPLYAANFRRKIAHMVEETGSYEENTQRRPARYYKYKFNWNSWE